MIPVNLHVKNVVFLDSTGKLVKVELQRSVDNSLTFKFTDIENTERFPYDQPNNLYVIDLVLGTDTSKDKNFSVVIVRDANGQLIFKLSETISD